jgi:Ran GTPase-activating protein (RanGAP) involved in mRNA processing and transport
MPYELYTDKIHKFNSLKEIPAEVYANTTDFDAISMKLVNISNIGLKCPKLERLNVSCNNILILDLTYFPNLKKLECSNNSISQIIGFENCHKLEEANFKLNYLKSIESNHNLKTLYIAKNNLDELPTFNNLEILDIRNNKLLQKIGSYPNMKHLLISNTSIKNIDFYKNLIQLECSNTLIKELHPYPKLKTLEYKNTLINKLPYLPSLELDDEVDDEDDAFYFSENNGYITLFNKKTMEKVDHNKN